MSDETSTIKTTDVAALVVELPDGAVRHPLAGIVSTVGRDLSNTICIPDRFVSKFHARLVYADHGFTVEDLGSENKTLVNGNAVTRERLQYGDQIHFADVSCRLLAPKDAARHKRGASESPPKPTEDVTRTAKLGERPPIRRPSPAFGTPDRGRANERLIGVAIGIGMVVVAAAVVLIIRGC